MHKDRLKIATALGYYARATVTDPITPYSVGQAIEKHGLPEYRYDIDCQVAFRKGWFSANEHFDAIRSFEVDKLAKLRSAIIEMIEEVKLARNELHSRLDYGDSSLFEIGINQRIPTPKHYHYQSTNGKPDPSLNYGPGGGATPVKGGTGSAR